MKFKIGDTKYEVIFSYVEGRLTMAYLMKQFEDGTWDLINEDQALCGLKDRFVRRTGRKIALGRLLRREFSKDVRTQIWSAYLSGNMTSLSI